MTSANDGAAPGNLARPFPDGIVPETLVERTERRWGYVVIGVLLAIAAVIVATGVTNSLHPPSSSETIDPAGLYQSAEFSESNLGAATDLRGGYVVRMIAQQYSFVPDCVTIPTDAPITIRITSADVVHGFLLAGTNVNSMVVPGYISKIVTRFAKAGTYVMPCHEFCGLGHAGMAARFEVVPKASFPDLPPSRRMRCDAQ